MADQEKSSPSKNDKKDQSGILVALGSKDGTEGSGEGQKSQPDLPPLPIPRSMEAPEGLEFKRSGIDSGKLGVWCTKAVEEGTTFGPFQGEKVTKTRKDSDPLHVWEIVDLETKEFLFYIDATRVEYGNWMRYTQCARFSEEQNIIAQQEGIDIVYKTLKPIKEGEELLTWYKLPSPKRGQRQVGRASGGRAKCLKELDLSPSEAVAKTGSASSSPNSKKKIASPASKAKLVQEDKTKGEAKKDADTKQTKTENESVPKKNKPVEVKAAAAAVAAGVKKPVEVKAAAAVGVKSEEVKSGEVKPAKVKPAKVKPTEVKPAKVKPVEGKQSEVKAAEEKPTEVKTPKVKQVEVKQVKDKQVKDKPAEINPTDVKPAKVKPEIVKPVEDKPVEVQKIETKKNETVQVKVSTTKVKPAEVKSEESKPADVKQEDAKLVDIKPSDVKQAEVKQCAKKDQSNKTKEDIGKVAPSQEDKVDKVQSEPKLKSEGPVKFQVKGAVTKEEELVDDIDDDHDGDELEIDLGEESNELEDEDLEDESDDSKMDCGKTNAVLDPEKYQFELKKHHITKSRYGRKVFKCDICSGVYRHAFSLKRHYIRNHINLKFVSRADILNCQISPDVHDLALASEKQGESKAKYTIKDDGDERALLKPSDTLEEEVCEGVKQSLMPLDGCDKVNKSSAPSFDVPGKVVDGQSEDGHEAGSVDVSDSKSISVCSDNSTEDEATSVLSKQLTGRVESALNGDKIKEELFVFSGLYRCNVCSKLFDNATGLKEHLENHPNLPTSKAFACDKCDMKFSHKQNLMRHLAVHTGEKPFLCKFCGKKFPTATNQKRHERIHLGRRISCEYCTSTFTQSGDLKKHIRKLHPECFHECAFCGKYFTDEDELSEHVTSHNESLRSNEEESNRRRDAFKVDMEIDRMESMRLAEQKTPGFKFACTVCKKRFHDYANMCRHRRLAHQRHLLISHGSTSSSPVPSPTKLTSDNSDSDPQAFFYANVASNISDNLNNYIEGTKEDIAKAASQLKRDIPAQVAEVPEKIKTKVKQEKKDFVNYNFPGGFSPKENYRKVVENKDEIAQILATDLKIVQQKDKTQNITGAKSVNKARDSTSKTEEICVSEVKFMENEKLGDNVTDLRAAELKVIQTLTDLKKMDEVNKAQAALKAVDLKVADKVMNLKVNKDDIDSKPLVSTVNGVSLNIPVFNVTNLNKKEVKIQPVCTVQPIQRQSQMSTEPAKQNTALVHSTKCSPPNAEKQKTTSPKAPIHEKAANVKTVTSSSLKNLPTSIKTPQGPSFSLKIPQVHVCPVCRRLFNNEIIFRQHMMDKHKTSPEENAAQNTNEKDTKSKDSDKNKVLPSPSTNNGGQNQHTPPMDLSGKASDSSPKQKPSIDHDEGARLLLDFAMGIREEVSRTQPTVNEEPSSDTSTPLDLSASFSHSSPVVPKKASVYGESFPRDVAHDISPIRCRVFEQAPAAHTSKLPVAPNAHSNNSKPQAAHTGNKIPAAHSGSKCNNKQGTVQGVLRIPNFELSPDADIPAPLATPPSMPKSPWQPQFPMSFGPKSSPVNIKKYICTVCYSEYGSRGALFSHQRASHPNVRCDHFEVDSDVVAPWWQKPSPVGMLNVCSSQVADLNPADQKQLICTKCSKKFTTTEDLHSHILDCADKIKKKSKPMMRPCPQPHPLHPRNFIPLISATTSTLSTVPSPDKSKPVLPAVVQDLVLERVGKTEDTPASATSTKPQPQQHQQQQQQQQEQPQYQQQQLQGQSKLAKMKTSILKRLKKRKSEEEDAGVVNKKKRRNPELLYNPQNHVRRREMTEVLDMQCCRGCGQHFSTISLLERHIPLCTEKDKLKTLQVSRNPIDSLHDPSELKNLCRYCHKQFTYTGMLRKHVFEICQMRKTRIQEGGPLDEEWEMEIGQYQSGTASVETCSNDGSHLDDAASTAASTSSHDTDASNRNKRKKRKNRGWGNSKKKRTLSDGLDVSPEFVDESWNPDGDQDVTGSEAAGNDDDDDFDGSVSDAEPIEATNTKVEIRPKPEIKELATDLCVKVDSKSGLGSKDLISEPHSETSKSTVSPPKRPTGGIGDIALASTVAVHSAPSIKYPIKAASDNEPKKVKNKSLSEHSHTTLPFVLSVPQYTERVPPIKNKTAKSAHGDKQGQAAEANKRKKVSAKEGTKKSKSSTELSPLKAAVATPTVNHVEQPLLGIPFRSVEVRETNAKAHSPEKTPKTISPKPLLIESKTSKSVHVSEQVRNGSDKQLEPCREINKTPQPKETFVTEIDKSSGKVPSVKDLAPAIEAVEPNLAGTKVVNISELLNITKTDQGNVGGVAVIKSVIVNEVQKQPEMGLSFDNVTSSQTKVNKDKSKALPVSALQTVCVVQNDTVKSKLDSQPKPENVGTNDVLPSPIQKTPVVEVSNGLVAASDVKPEGLGREIIDKVESDVKDKQVIETPAKVATEPPKEEETDESSDEEDIKEYINSFLAARRNKVNNKSGKAKGLLSSSPKTLTSKDKGQRPVLSCVVPDKGDTTKTSPVKSPQKNESQAKKTVTSPKKFKAVDKKNDNPKAKAIKKAVGTLKSIKNQNQGGSPKKGTEKVKRSPSVGPALKKTAKPKASVLSPPVLEPEISHIAWGGVTKNKEVENQKRPLEGAGSSAPVGGTDPKETKASGPTKQTKPKKKAADTSAASKVTQKNKSGNKDKKIAPPKTNDAEGNTTPKGKKPKISADSSKTDTKNPTTLGQESGSSPKKEKVAKSNAGKSQKGELPKKGSQNKTECVDDKVASDSDTATIKNRKRKLATESNQEGSTKSKAVNKGLTSPPAKVARTRGVGSKTKDLETEEKEAPSNNVKTKQQTRRGTRSTASKDEPQDLNKDPETAQKVKTKKIAKKESPVKMKRSVSVITRQINDEKVNKGRGQASPKPMRTRQSRHSL